jgi:Peptidase A4 family
MMTSTYGLGVQTFPAPPAGFDLEKASDTERAKYGMPRLHRLPALERRWVEATRGTRFITPKLTPGESVLPQRDAGDVELDDVLYDSQFVGCTVMAPGYEGGVASAHPFAAVYGCFNVPEVWPGASAQAGVQQSLSPWVGMGFWLGGSILQAGCACIVTPADTPLGESQYLYAPWFEWWPNHATYLTSEDVQHPDPLAVPGDQFVCSLLYCPWIIPELSDDGIDALGLLSNRTQGWSCLISASAPDEHPFYGYDADWIIEVHPTGFPQMSAVQFTNCQTWTKNDISLTSAAGDTTDLVDLNNNVLATATLNPPDKVYITAT